MLIHNIPLKNSSVDGVIIQAVLEHVLEQKLLLERYIEFLKKWISFAETPFLQNLEEHLIFIDLQILDIDGYLKILMKF